MSGYGKAHADRLGGSQPELRAPFVCEEALLARGSFSLMQRRGRRTLSHGEGLGKGRVGKWMHTT